ncbi:helix-turn-helix domain-containing protein [Saxibacter everestensis]|uniref:Helix-turn-helix domain-containing protein n=1 Tax=Saxibacter everestensis TaxID=2909229 RepID=A0ABY8QSA1_9MICO|nr:helix-turn-helix domain-containing protein [Brevibacteriaceae bacterium ZFBP1038]
MSNTAVRRYAPGRARQNELLDAAYVLFSESGFAGVSLRDIAARTGISHASLLRYYSSKDELLLALLDRWEHANLRWAADHPQLTGDSIAIAFARRNAAMPGYVELFSALAGEATSEQHPGHEHFARRYERLRRGSEFAEPMPAAVAAVWDGLQIASLYLDIDVPNELEAFLSGEPAAPNPALSSVSMTKSPGGRIFADHSRGYAPGRTKRAHIVQSATALFAQRGFSATSLQDIARQVGISKSTLLHHVGSKDALLETVLRQRDARIEDTAARRAAGLTPTLAGIVEGAHMSAIEPGLVELYTVLVCEATPTTHPAHGYFTTRYHDGIRYFGALFEEARAEGAQTGDPWREALWFIALWDGMQIQWLYDANAVDIGVELNQHLDRLVGCR